MNYFYIAFTLFFAQTFATEYKEENNVIILQYDNFNEALQKFEYILVEFYAPWCPFSKKFALEYSQAAKILKQSIPLAKVDVTIQSYLAERNDIQEYPQLKLFVNKKPIEYTGVKNQLEIVNWVIKIIQKNTSELKTGEIQQKIIKDNQVAIIFYGEKNSSEFIEFKIISKTMENLVFFHVFDSNLRNSLINTTQPRIILYKQFDEGRNVFAGPFHQGDIKRFINGNKYPTVMPFDERAAQRIFVKSHSAIFLLYSENTQGQQAQKAFEKAANNLKGNILLSKSTIDGSLGKRLAEFFGVKSKDLPTIRLVQFMYGDMRKFTFNGEMNGGDITKFYQEFREGKLKPILQSQEIPLKNEDYVKIVVGKNFKDIVLDAKKDVLVLFYAPWCMYSQAVAPIYEDLAKSLVNQSNLIIAKIDVTANEIDGVFIQAYPTIKLWPANVQKPQIDFNGERSVEGFSEFLIKQLGTRWIKNKEEI